MQELARVIDPAALDREGLTTGRLAIDVLPEWLDRREIIAFVVPKRVTCARCDGGGCDACDRSGAFRVEGDDAARTLQLTLPAAPAVVRIPFTSAPKILLIELRSSTAPTGSTQVVPKTPSRWWIGAVLIAALLLAALLASR